MFILLLFGCFLILCYLWRLSNRFTYGLLVKSSCVFILLLQLLGFVYCWFLQNYPGMKAIGFWYGYVCSVGYNYENLLSNTCLTYVFWVYVCFLLSFTLGVFIAIKGKHFSRHIFHFQEDFIKNRTKYLKINVILSVLVLCYWVVLYYKMDLYPFKKLVWDFNSDRYVALPYYSSVICLISRTIPFIIFIFCWYTRNLIVKVFGFVCFIYGFSFTWKTSSVLTILLLTFGCLYVFYNKIFKSKILLLFICCLFTVIICRFSVRKIGTLERILNSNIGDVLAINYYKDNFQGFKFINSFIRKGLGDRKQITFAEEWNRILTNNKINCSSGVGCIAGSWVNFNWLGGSILFIFGYIVGYLEIFFSTRKKFLIYWYSIYILLGFQIGNVFVISFLSCFISSGLIVTCGLFMLGLLLERFSVDETN